MPRPDLPPTELSIANAKAQQWLDRRQAERDSGYEIRIAEDGTVKILKRTA